VYLSQSERYGTVGPGTQPSTGDQWELDESFFREQPDQFCSSSPPWTCTAELAAATCGWIWNRYIYLAFISECEESRGARCMVSGFLINCRSSGTRFFHAGLGKESEDLVNEEYSRQTAILTFSSQTTYRSLETWSWLVVATTPKFEFYYADVPSLEEFICHRKTWANKLNTKYMI